MFPQLFLASILMFQAAPSAAVPVRAAIPDQVVLDNGHAISGRVVADWPSVLRVRTRGGDYTLRRENVRSVLSLETSLSTALDRWDAMPRNDPVALGELASFCAARGLTGDAANIWLRILTLDPKSELAAREIGARRIDGAWQIQSRRGWMKLADYLAAKPRWRDAVDLRTGHFIVRTDLPLERVLPVTVALERQYRRFYEVLGSELPLYTFGQVPIVNIYARSREFASPPLAGEQSWFEPSDDQLHVLADNDLDMHRITRDVTEMMIFNTLRRSSVKNGEMMPWANRGLSEYFAASHADEPDGRSKALEQPDYASFEKQLDDSRRLTLTRLLNTSLSEFRNGPDGERTSLRAYTLVHFLLNGDGGSHREDFYRYLRTAWLGRGGRMLLYKELGLNPRDLEQRWRQYVVSVVASHSTSPNPTGIGALITPPQSEIPLALALDVPSSGDDHAAVGTGEPRVADLLRGDAVLVENPSELRTGIASHACEQMFGADVVLDARRLRAARARARMRRAR